MGEVKKKRIKKLSDYEETLIWMSYRYAIGRHTIASHSHAGDIAQNSYERLLLTPTRMQFMAKDINSEISSRLSWSSFNFRIDQYYGENRFGHSPLDLFYEFINSLNITDVQELGKYKDVHCYIDNFTGEVRYETKLNEDDSKRYVSFMDYEDYECWQTLAKVFDLKHHKFCKCIYNGEESIIEYVDIYRREMRDDGLIKYEKVKMPIDGYLKNTYISTRINEDYIVEDNLQLNNYNV